MNPLKLLFISLFFVSLQVLAQSHDKEKVVDEFIKRFNNGNDDIVNLYYNNNADREEARSFREKLGEINDWKLTQKKGNTFLYGVILSNAGEAVLKIVFKGNLIKKYSLETSKEYQIRAGINELISKSMDTLQAAYMALDMEKAFKEIDHIEKLYLSINHSKENDFKYRIKFIRAELFAFNGNDDEALRLLGELKKEKPEFMKEAIYNCSFASLQSKPEFIRLTGNPLELYFALSKPVNDSIRQCADAKRWDDVLDYLSVKDSLYTTLSSEDRANVSYMRFLDEYFRAGSYSMKGNTNEAMRLLKEMKAKGWGYAVNYSLNDSAFTNLKQMKEYETLISDTNCNCEEVLGWAVTEFEKNDAGFDYAMEMKGKDAYEKHTMEKQAESKSISSSNDCVRLVNEWLSFFRKSHIGFSISIPIFPSAINSYEKFAVDRLSIKTMYVKIKSFSGSKSQQAISDMIESNDFLLSNTPNLIIDLRGNEGGLYKAWDPLRKYIDSKPVYLYDIMTRVSEENAIRTNNANLVNNNPSKRFSGRDSSITINYPKAQKFPENIVILVDEKTGSSSESFLIYAKQSNKVKVMGQKTNGTTEVGNIEYLESPDKQFLLEYGATIMSQAKYTQYLDYGIQPDIFLRKDRDWIEEARKYLEY